MDLCPAIHCSRPQAFRDSIQGGAGSVMQCRHLAASTKLHDDLEQSHCVSNPGHWCAKIVGQLWKQNINSIIQDISLQFILDVSMKIVIHCLS